MTNLPSFLRQNSGFLPIYYHSSLLVFTTVTMMRTDNNGPKCVPKVYSLTVDNFQKAIKKD